jgi:hypothetical protein
MGGWAWIQARQIGVLEAENRSLERHLAKHRDRASRYFSGTARSTALDARPIDWLEVVREIRSNEGGFGYLKTTRRLDDAFLSMSFEELVGALGEVGAAPDLSEDDRGLLRQAILQAMFASYPHQALTRFASRYHDPDWEGRNSQAFSAWAKRSPDAAAAWLEEQFAAGTFDARLPDGRTAFPDELVRGAVFSTLASALVPPGGTRRGRLPRLGAPRPHGFVGRGSPDGHRLAGCQLERRRRRPDESRRSR